MPARATALDGHCFEYVRHTVASFKEWGVEREIVTRCFAVGAVRVDAREAELPELGVEGVDQCVTEVERPVVRPHVRYVEAESASGKRFRTSATSSTVRPKCFATSMFSKTARAPRATTASSVP